MKEIHWVEPRERRKRVIGATMEVSPGSAQSRPGSKPPRLSLFAGRLPSTSADESLSWRIVLYFTSRCSPLPLPLLPRRGDHKLLNIKPCFQSVRRGGGCQGPSRPLSSDPPARPSPTLLYFAPPQALRREARQHLRLHVRLSPIRTCITPCSLQGRAPASATGRSAGAPADLQNGSRLKTTYIFPDNLSPNGPQSLNGINGDAARNSARSSQAREIAQPPTA